MIRKLMTGASFGCALLLSATTYGQLSVSNAETLVNNTTANAQQNPAVSQDTAGRYVVVWESEGQDGDGFGIYAEIYNADHTVRVPEFLVNSHSGGTVGDQRHPDVAMDINGNFVVAWQSQEDHLLYGQEWDVYRRSYDIDGTALSTSFRVNSTSSRNQQRPAVAINETHIVVAYMSQWGVDDYSIRYRFISATTYANLMSPATIDDGTAVHVAHPDVEMDDAGNALFVWQADGLDGDRKGIYAAGYNFTGGATFAQTLINTTTAGNQQEPSVGVDAAGNAMIVWSSFGQDGDHQGIYSQLLNTSGALSGSEVIVNTTTSGSQDHARVAASREGNKFILTWTDENGDADRQGVMATHYEAGSFQGGDVLINTTTNGRQMLSDVVFGSENHEAIIAWQGGNRKAASSGADSDDYGVYVASATTEDVTPPTAVCQNITVFLDGSGNVSIVPADVDGGSTDNVGVTSLTLNTNSWTCADIGTNNVVLTVGDAAGNTAACGAIVTVMDTAVPSAVCQDLTVYLDGTGNASITAGDVDNGSSDNCSIDTYAISQSSFTCADVGSNTVTLTVTDPSGNIGTCNSTVTVLDTISPSASCQNLTVYLDGAGNATIVGADMDAGSTDNCGGSLTFGLSQSAFTCTDIGANSVTLTVTDPGGNISSCSGTVTVLDTVSPTAVCQNITVYLDGTGNATITAADVDGGTSDNCGTPTLGIDVSSFNCLSTGPNNVTLTATDGSGNISTCSATVTVVDSISPTAVCQDITVYLDGAGNATITSGDIDGGSSDNCGIASLALSQSSFDCSMTGANSVTLTVTDDSGNSDACTATVTVIDSVTPIASCQDLTIYLDGTGNATITTGDVDNGSSDNCSIASYALSQSAFDCSMTGANSVTLTVTDASGNVSTCSSTVTVIDSVTPTAVCQDITVYLDGTGNASITTGDIDGGSSDNCGIASLALSQSAFDCSMTGANSVTLTVTDPSGNSDACTATVTVIDSVTPTAVCQNITVYLDGAGNATITAGDVDGGSSDNCGTPTLGIDVSSFTCANVGANNVTLTATDASGNVASCTATVTIVDSISPTAVCQDLTIYLDGTGNATITTGDVDNGSSDNCSIASYALSQSSFDCSMTGANSVTLTVTDASGNVGSCTATVTVIDSVTPTAVCQDITVYLDGTGNATIAAADVDGGSSDNCGAPTLGVDVSSFTCADIGANNVTLTATDASGNVASCTAIVTVADTISPAIPTLADLTDECTVTATAPTTSDNCGTITGTTTDPLTYTGEGTYVITWTFDDGNGNTTTATQNVIIDDVTAPVTPTLADLTDECTVTVPVPTTTDNCSGTITGSTIDPLTYTGDGTYVVTWTFDDGNGNTTIATQNVIIADVTPPTASNLDTAYAECIGDVPVDVTLVDDEADNCTTAPAVTYVGDVASNGTGCNDTIVRTYSVADDAGNTINVEQIIILNDVTPPTASNPVTLDVVCLADVPTAAGAISWVTDEADNCGTPTVTWLSDVSSNGTGCNDTITRTFEVSDACGNAIQVQQLIIVNDDIAPVADTTLADAVGFCDVTPATPTATDNCEGSINGVADVTFPINTPGTTVVTWTYTDACGNTTTQTQNVVINAIDVSTYFAPDGITIVASNNDAGVTFQWINCETNDPLPGETNQNFTPTYSGDFAVIVTQDGCSDTSDCVPITGVGLPDLFTEEFTLYPNPTTGQFTVSFNGNIQSIEMIDVTGRIVMTKTQLHEGLVDASLLAPGKYMVRLTSESGTIHTEPIVIGQQ